MHTEEIWMWREIYTEREIERDRERERCEENKSERWRDRLYERERDI